VRWSRGIASPPRPLAFGLVGVVLPLLLFCGLALRVTQARTPSWDLSSFRYLERWGPPGNAPGHKGAFSSEAVEFLVRLADRETIVVTVILLLAALAARRRFADALLFLASIAVAALAPLLKIAFERPGPFPGERDSFPSGHATASMALALSFLALLSGTRWLWGATAAAAMILILIGLAVVSGGGHWPSDILAGWSLSLAWVSCVSLLAARHKKTHRVQ